MGVLWIQGNEQVGKRRKFQTLKRHNRSKHLKELGLKARKGTPDSQVRFLPCINRHCLVFIWLTEILHSHMDLVIRDCGEMSPVNLCLWIKKAHNYWRDQKQFVKDLETNLWTHNRNHCINHFKANILTLLVTIQPKNKRRRPLGFFLKKIHHIQFWICFFFLNLREKQFNLHKISKKKWKKLTGSTASQLLKRPTKSRAMTWPHTEVILKRTGLPRKVPFHSWILHAPLLPLRDVWSPCDIILARASANEGFSATIKTTCMLRLQKSTRKYWLKKETNRGIESIRTDSIGKGQF